MEVYRQAFDDKDPSNFSLTHSTDEATHVEFYYNKVAEKDYCRMTFPGNKLTVWDQPVREQDKARFARQWELYKSGKDQFGGQTMIEQWGDIDQGSQEIYRSMNVRTVEALAQLPDVNMGEFPPGHASLAYRHRDMARQFVEDKSHAAGFDQAIAAAEQSQSLAMAAFEENAELKSQIEAMRAQMEALAAGTGEPAQPSPSGDWPRLHKRKPGGWEYQISNGEIIVGKEAAQQAQAAIDATG